PLSYPLDFYPQPWDNSPRTTTPVLNPRTGRHSPGLLKLDEVVGPSDLPVNLNISLEQPEKKLALFGSADRFLRMIRDAFAVQLVNRDEDLRISGENAQVTKAAAVLEQLQRKLRQQDWLTTEDVTAAIGKAAIEPHQRV